MARYDDQSWETGVDGTTTFVLGAGATTEAVGATETDRGVSTLAATADLRGGIVQAERRGCGARERMLSDRDSKLVCAVDRATRLASW